MKLNFRDWDLRKVDIDGRTDGDLSLVVLELERGTCAEDMHSHAPHTSFNLSSGDKSEIRR
ncbi:MAG TPA: hypothetical protein PKY05_14510, partial [Fibrobacteria bacterium]|nr:hypothetical protein [Fibrobacteria bacterium]